MLEGPVDVAFVTLNPGGDAAPDGDRPPSCENGVAYLVERWGANEAGGSLLQREVRELFRLVALEMGSDESPERLLARSALSSFVPFRSSTFATLVRPADSIAFARLLWPPLLARLRPRLLVVLSRPVQRAFAAMIPDALGCPRESSVRLPTGWGTIHAEIDEFRHDDAFVRLLYLPHLSRYRLFSTARCRPFMRQVVATACAGVAWRRPPPGP